MYAHCTYLLTLGNSLHEAPTSLQPQIMSQSLADGTDSLLIHISRLSLTEIDALQALLDADLSFEHVSDEDLAIWMFAEEARSLLTIAKEFRDGDEDHGDDLEQFLLEELEEIEEMARYDREVAIAISEERPIPPPNPRRHKFPKRRGR